MTIRTSEDLVVELQAIQKLYDGGWSHEWVWDDDDGQGGNEYQEYFVHEDDMAQASERLTILIEQLQAGVWMLKEDTK